MSIVQYPLLGYERVFLPLYKVADILCAIYNIIKVDNDVKGKGKGTDVKYIIQVLTY